MAFTSSLRFSGINTGWDTDTMVQSMMKAENVRLSTLQKSLMLDTYRQEQYRATYTDLTTFQKDFLNIMKDGSLRSASTFQSQMTAKGPDGKDSTAVSMGPNSARGKYEVEVKQLAVSDLYESRARIGGNITSKDGFKFDMSSVRFGTSYDITLDGAKKNISFNAGDKVPGGKFVYANGQASIQSDAYKTVTGTEADLRSMGQLEFNVTSSVTENGKTTNKTVKITADTTGGKSDLDIMSSINKQLMDAGMSDLSVDMGTDGKITLTNRSDTTSYSMADTTAGAGSMAAMGLSGGASVDSRTTAMTEEQFMDLFNQKLGDAFGTDAATGHPKVEVSLTDSGGVSFTTNGYHTGFTIANGNYAFGSQTGKAPSLSARDTLGMMVTSGDKMAEISVETKGKTSQQIIDEINSQLGDADLGDRLMAELNSDGTIKFTNYSTTNTVTVGDSYDGNGTLKDMGFAEGRFTIAAAGGLTDLGITSGTTARVNDSSTLGDLFGDALPTSERKFTINGAEFSFSAATKISDLIDGVNNADVGVKMSYDSANATFKLEATETGVVNKISMSGVFLTDTLGFGGEPSRAAADSVAVIDGTTITRSNNSYNYNGVDWTFNKTTDGDTLTVSSSTDNEKAVESIKGFIDGYNALVEKLRTQTQTTRPKSQGSYFDPLTDEERADMKESDIKLWDEKAKTGLLYNDSILEGIESQLRSVLSQSVTMADGSKLSLASLGITTSSDWTKGGVLEIKDEKKLRDALDKYGDQVGDLFGSTAEGASKGLAERVNDVINDATSSTGPIARKAGIAGTYTETNNELFRKLTAQNDAIEKLMETLATKEQNYYNKFGKIEAAMGQAQSQMQYVQSMLG